MPLELAEASEAALVCGACLQEPPPFDRARSALVYDEASAALILQFKNADRTDAAPALARWMVYAGRDLWAADSVLVPVPQHWTRLFARRYNQAALLAGAIGRATGLATEPRALVRWRRTPSQGTQGRGARQVNVRGAFRVADPRAVEGRAVILIDDVMTTGATVGACARAVRTARPRRVDVLTLARPVAER